MIELIISFSLGVMTWSFLEYAIHRWLGHYKPFQPNFFSKEHLQHHSKGNYFAPLKKKMFMVAIGFKLSLPIAWLVFGFQLGTAWLSGLFLMYLTYEWVHWRFHNHEGIGFYGRYLRRHHFYHHFVEPKMNHGVTSPIWDVVFGTYRTPAVIPVPMKLAMPWLLVGENQLLQPSLTDSYYLTGQRR